MSRRCQTSRRSLKRGAVLGALTLMMLAALGVVLIPIWDDIGIEGRECTVTGASAASSGGGRSPTLPIVRIETNDCGALSWQQGVTFDNSAEIAASFAPGVYNIETGWFSRTIMPLLPDGLPTVKSFTFLRE
ncbi:MULTISPECIES: hypothetical protein [Microbacterium]|uniref:hypothetical protein n=1 Tax=Microbacterium TaxID=33882 RepID=UPI00277D5635|nr:MULTISPECIES: hypothetical protein [Microbacterium]MDQ1075118.1 hypothetical protein [Microbacterium sp. SORGH_AS_0969]MDQ1115349.1 hypothetical protein [Microbacterium testaceum]